MKKKNKYLKHFFTSTKQLAVDQLVVKKGYAEAALNPLYFCDTATEQSVFSLFPEKQHDAFIFLYIVLYLADN